MSGLLGKADLEADTNTDIYTVPADRIATVNISLCNRADTPHRVHIALSDHPTDTDVADYIEYDTSIPAHGILERTGIVLSAGERVVVWADDYLVSVRVHGFVENE